MVTTTQSFQVGIPKRRSSLNEMMEKFQRRGSFTTTSPLADNDTLAKRVVHVPSPYNEEWGIPVEFHKEDFSSKLTTAVNREEDVKPFQAVTEKSRASLREVTNKLRKRGSIVPMPARKTSHLANEKQSDNSAHTSSPTKGEFGNSFEAHRTGLSPKHSPEVNMNEYMETLMDFYARKRDIIHKSNHLVTGRCCSVAYSANSREIYVGRKSLIQLKQSKQQYIPDMATHTDSHHGTANRFGRICVRCNDFNNSKETSIGVMSGASEPAASSTGVRFDCVEIREYPVVLGDRACSSGGPALTIGWNHISTVVTCVCTLEARREKKGKRNSRLPRAAREKKLMCHGYTELELARAADRIDKKCSQTMPLPNIEGAYTKMCKTIFR